jgi:transposase
MRAYSLDLREKVILAYETGAATLDEIAESFVVDRRTITRWLKKYRAGESLAPKPHGGGYPASLDERMLEMLCQQLLLQPDATLAELSAFLLRDADVKVHLSTVCRALQRLGLPRKKKPGVRRASGIRTGLVQAKDIAVGSRPLYLHRRNRVPFGDDTPVRASQTWATSCRQSATQSRHRSLADRVAGAARMGLRDELARIC